MSKSTTKKDPIPWVNLSGQHALIKEEVLLEIERVFNAGQFSDGAEVSDFEQAFANYCQVNHAVAVNNGTNALHLALLALNIGPEDEVIVPANGFIAALWAVSYVGAKPVLVDCLPNTWQIDPQLVEDAITDSTKAVIAVHLYGQPCDMDALKKAVESRNVAIVEDASHAHGAKFNGQMAGGLGDVGCFSFYPTKNLGTTGEGGALVLNDDGKEERLRALRNNASTEKNIHTELGFNMRMGAIEAAVLKVKLKHLDKWNAERKAIAERYQCELKNDKIQLQFQPSFAESVHHLFVIKTSAEHRAKLLNHLRINGIEAGVHYPVPCHLQPAYAQLGYKRGDFPNSESLADGCLSLPMYPSLKQDEVTKVVEAVNAY